MAVSRRLAPFVFQRAALRACSSPVRPAGISVAIRLVDKRPSKCHEAGRIPPGRTQRRGEDREPSGGKERMFARLTWLVLFGVVAVTPVRAEIEIQWWHAMTGGNNDVVVRLAGEFNAAQPDY